MDDPTEVAVLVRRFSPERLGPYVIAAGRSPAAALDLYVWNAEVSAALATTIGYVEVVLRNAMHDNLTTWSTREYGEPRWYLDPGHLLQTRTTEDIRVARQHARRRGRQPETPGRVVAELNFGFWRFLLSNQYDTTLWRYSLYRAFPGQVRRRSVHEAVDLLRLARNRLAHHEAMFNRPIEDIQFTALELAGWICPATRSWIAEHSRAGALLADRPAPGGPGQLPTPRLDMKAGG